MNYPQSSFILKQLIFIICLGIFLSPLYAQVGIGTTIPDPSSVLDISSTSQGILAPRMTTVQRNAIATPADGLLLYDLDLDAFYFYDATATAAWRALLASSKSTASLGGWSTLGNAGTVATTNFLGTTDAIDFRIRTTNLDRMTILAGGNLGIGTTTPNTLLHVSAGTAGDAGVTIEADTDNNNENDNPYVEFLQDGGFNYGLIGLVNTAFDPKGVASTNALSNAFHLSSDNAIQFANDGVVAMTIRNATQEVGIGTNAPESRLQVYGGAADTWLTLGASDAAAYNTGIYMKENETTAGNSRGFKLYYNSWDFYIDRNNGGADANVLFIDRTNGDVGIGTTAPAVKLHVNGTIRGTVIQATTNGAGAYQYNTTTNMNVPDYVFDKYYTGNAPENPVYEIMPLDKLEKYIQKNRHLPRVPSRSEINKDGFINTQAISMLTLEKAEENTLYILELNKKIKEQQKVIEELRNEINATKKEIESMIKTLQLQLNVPVEK